MNHYYNNRYIIRGKLAGNIVSATAASQRKLRGADLWSGSHYDVDELLVFSGADFIDIAYRAVLKRAPDQSGFAFYSSMLDQGISRQKILGVLRYSPGGTPYQHRTDRPPACHFLPEHLRAAPVNKASLHPPSADKGHDPRRR